MEAPAIPTWVKVIVGVSVAIGSTVGLLRNIDTNNTLILESQKAVTAALTKHSEQTDDLLKVICINGVTKLGKEGRDQLQNCLSPKSPVISWPGETEPPRPAPRSTGRARGSGLPPGRMFDD